MLLHEVAHHALGHTTQWTSQPTWSVEYETDQHALAMMHEFHPQAVAIAEKASKDHIRPMLQGMIDCGIWHHVDIDIARAVGCTIPEDMPEGQKYRYVEADADIPF